MLRKNKEAYMNKKVMLSLHTGGSFIVTFNDEKDYEIFTKERSKYIGMIIATFITFALSVLSFILMFDYSIFIYFFIGLMLLFVLNTKIFYEIENRYNYYKYDLIIKEIKKNKYRIDYSNDRTGHISYTKKGECHSIDVFKGKGNRSAR